MPYLLHIDTSADSAFAAISKDGVILSKRINIEVRNHAASINLIIESLMAETEISFTDISGISVCGGPGSYTGLRIGLATAKGLCYALDKPLLLDNKLALLSCQSFRKHGDKFEQYISLITARAKEYFVAIYDNEFNCTLEPQHIAEEQLNYIADVSKKTFLITDANTLPEELLNHRIIQIESDLNIDLEQWANYAFNRFKCHDIEILATSEPFYLKQVYTHK